MAMSDRETLKCSAGRGSACPGRVRPEFGNSTMTTRLAPADFGKRLLPVGPGRAGPIGFGFVVGRARNGSSWQGQADNGGMGP